MAKNQNEDIDLVNDMDLDDEEEKDGKKNGKMMTSIVALFIVLIWVAIFALLIKLDVGGFGSSVMYPVLKNVPVLNKILPKNAGEEISSQSGDTYSTLQDAIDRINELENEISLYKSNADDNAETISNLQAELSRLKAYEENQSNYEQLKKKFDNEVVFTNNAPDIQEYKTWYEQMDPDNAAEIYRQVVEQLQVQQETGCGCGCFRRNDGRSRKGCQDTFVYEESGCGQYHCSHESDTCSQTYITYISYR